MKRRKWMAVGLAAVMALSLAACGSGSSGAGPPQQRLQAVPQGAALRQKAKQRLSFGTLWAA